VKQKLDDKVTAGYTDGIYTVGDKIRTPDIVVLYVA
jgi:hypothetical protein